MRGERGRGGEGGEGGGGGERRGRGGGGGEGGEGGRTGMNMYLMTPLYCNYLEMIKAQFLIGQHFLGFTIIKKLKTSCQETHMSK